MVPSFIIVIIIAFQFHTCTGIYGTMQQSECCLHQALTCSPHQATEKAKLQRILEHISKKKKNSTCTRVWAGI